MRVSIKNKKSSYKHDGFRLESFFESKKTKPFRLYIYIVFFWNKYENFVYILRECEGAKTVIIVDAQQTIFFYTYITTHSTRYT